MSIHKEHRWALLTAAILALVAGYFILSDHSGSISPRASNFSIGKIEKVTEFRISHGAEVLTVKKEKGSWMANGQYKVKENLPEVFLKTINSVKVKAPASRLLRTSLRNRLLHEGVRIDVYKGIFRVRSYHVVYDSSQHESYFMKNWSKIPISIEIPGMHFPVAEIFRTSVQYWKDKSIFPYAPEQIESVRLDYPSDSSRSFSILQSGRGRIELFAKNKTEIKETDLLALNDYLGSFRRLEYLKSVDPKDKAALAIVKNVKPLYIFTLQATGAKPVIFTIYPFFGQPADQSRPDPVTFIGTLSTDSAPFLARYADFDPVLRDASFFVKQ